MNFPIEHKGRQVFIVANVRLAIAIEPKDNSASIVQQGEKVEVCSWCRNDFSKTISDMKYNVSNGCCAECGKAYFNNGGKFELK